jgi:bifunctional enzyme CysN/CysC
MENQDLNIVIVGHVDHGKSTVIGRLLADTDALPQGTLEQIKEMCRKNARPFEYAFLLDALKDERSQGITIDTARSFFKTDKRRYIIIDAPGHIEFLKNMITGASRAEAALLVIDAKEGVQENSRRHGYMLSVLGISQIVVLVNKMDLVDYDENIYNNIVAEYSEFLRKINVKPESFIPVSAMEGDNIAAKSSNMAWFNGMTVLEALDNFKDVKLPDDLPFRMPVQDVYKFTASGDDRRIIAGTIDSGVINGGDEVIFYPSGKKTRIKSIEIFNAPKVDRTSAGFAAGFTVSEQIFIKRGELCVKASELKPLVSTAFKTSLFWLGKTPMTAGGEYFLKIGAAKVNIKLKEIIKVINASNLDEAARESINKHEVAECILEAERPVAFDIASVMPFTSRFVIVDKNSYEISGGGIITENVADDYSDIREKVLLRNFKWEQGSVTPAMRAERFCQRASMLIITGSEGVDKKIIAKSLERILFNDGRIIYYLGIGNILYGVDSDINKINKGERERKQEREEHIRRLAEVGNILLETGAILIVTATSLTSEDIGIIRTVLSREPENIITYWIGESVETDIKPDMIIQDYSEASEALESSGVSGANKAALVIKSDLQDRNIIYKA